MKPKSFEQKLKWNMYTMGVLFFIFLAVSLLAKMGVYPESPFSSLGFCGVIFCGVQFIRIDRLLHDEEKRAQTEVSAMDERNIFKNRRTAPMPCFLLFACLLPFLSVASWHLSMRKSFVGCWKEMP